MAIGTLTVRNLSKKAEKQLSIFLKEDNGINTATKSIEAILEEREDLLKRKEELFKLQVKHRDLEIDVAAVKAAIRMLFTFHK